VLWFEGPASFTGEDSAELTSMVVRRRRGGDRALEAAGVVWPTRRVHPRAFENGKLDLTQAEAVADLVDAQTEAQRRQALGSGGRARRSISGLA
jgi:tRNA modification GTPase